MCRHIADMQWLMVAIEAQRIGNRWRWWSWPMQWHSRLLIRLSDPTTLSPLDARWQGCSTAKVEAPFMDFTRAIQFHFARPFSSRLLQLEQVEKSKIQKGTALTVTARVQMPKVDRRDTTRTSQILHPLNSHKSTLSNDDCQFLLLDSLTTSWLLQLVMSQLRFPTKLRKHIRPLNEWHLKFALERSQ